MIAPGQSGYYFDYRAELGRDAHKKRQESLKKDHSDFNGECQISRKFEFGEVGVLIRGRPDAVYEEGDFTVVEEIKTVISGKEVFAGYTPDTLGFFKAQLDIYCYLLNLDGCKNLKARLYLINLADSGGERFLDYTPDFGTIAYALEKALTKILTQNSRLKNRDANLKSAAEEIEFPFTNFRPHQKQMMDEAAACVDSEGRLLLSAPTGMGKTAGVLFPAMTMGWKLGKKVFFATAKTTHRHIVRDLVDRLKQQGAPFSALFLTSRVKLCPRQAEVCEFADCPYLLDFEEKMARFGFTDEMYDGAVLDGEDILRRVLPVKMCPFQVSIRLAEHADLVVGDYNYVFDPRIVIKRLFAEKGAADYTLIVDEAHNLPDRVRGYYSPELFADETELLLAGLKGKNYLDGFFRKAAVLLRGVVKIFNGYAGTEGQVELDAEKWGELGDKTERLLMEYYLSSAENVESTQEDPLIRYMYDLSWFCKTANLDGGIAALYENRSRMLKLICLDPGLRLKEYMEGFHAVIAMSATLNPPEFYANTLGLYETAYSVNYPYPFPQENREIRIIGNVSTQFKFRSRFVKSIGQIIDETYNSEPGGYFVFFPSYAYMKDTAQYIQSPFLMQESEMNEEARSRFLTEVSAGGKVFLAVMGGIFAEGVDYPGQLSGVMVVGPGLPLFCAETEMIRNYYDELYGSGFEYAYVYPGMNRVIQAAGRLIRSETDRGSITLICERFLKEPYKGLLPRDWGE